MAIPRYDLIVQSLTAGASYTTSFEVLNYNQCAVQLVWSGLDSAVGTFRLKASNDGTNWENLTTFPYTMISASDNHLFNMYQIGYGYMQVAYGAVSNTTGTLALKITRKSS